MFVSQIPQLKKWRSGSARLGYIRWGMLGGTVIAAVIAAIILFSMFSNGLAMGQKRPDASATLATSDPAWRLLELSVDDPLIAPPDFQDPPSQDPADGSCPQQTVTYSTHNFTSGGFTAQQGFVATEIAAATYTLDPSNFPIRIDRVDGLFGTQTLSGQTTTHWTMMVWEGKPNTGKLICTVGGCTIQSDGKNPPHMVVGPPNNAVTLQVLVDPGDPEQIIVTNDGSNQFSVGFRIDQHNNPPTSSCLCVPGCGICGTLPAVCCPPNASTNIFPTTDATMQGQQPNFPAQNWIWARACPGSSCALASGWYTFQQLAQLGASISGDWNIRALFTPTGCATPVGACCLNNGNCLNALSAGACAAQGGNYQGDNTSCGSVNCPIPSGTCCLPSGSCIVTTTTNCASQGGTFIMQGGVCNTNTCRGACCVPATQQCVFTTQANCTAANGVFQGIGTACAGTCFGACCLPSGNCVTAISANDCSTQGGTWQGGGVSCANANCPQPTGACCLGASCLSDLSETDCEIGFGGQWLGPNSTCDFNPCDPLGACCLGTTCLTDLTQSDCTVGFGGVWQGAQSTCSPSPCVPQNCPGDIAPPGGNGVVNVQDMLAVINAWGSCAPPCPPSCLGDVNNSCAVNVQDLLAVINAWGPCP